MVAPVGALGGSQEASLNKNKWQCLIAKSSKYTDSYSIFYLDIWAWVGQTFNHGAAEYR